MGFMISDITSDMFYLVLQESLKTGGGGGTACDISEQS